jgi:hypothetical protein
MPALLEVQRALRARLLGTGGMVEDPREAEILEVYRHTVTSTLVNALRLSFPVIVRLVGAEFFEGAAREFIALNAPRSACLNDYGETFAPFLGAFAPAATLPYLSDVAQLEWAVDQALHAEDAPGLDPQRLAGLRKTAPASIVFSLHPSINLLQLTFPADDIWRAVLDADDAAMARIDLKSGPVHVLIERDRGGVQVRRMESWAWVFTQSLASGASLQTATERSPVPEGPALNALLAEHLTSGRFINYSCVGEASP